MKSKKWFAWAVSLVLTLVIVNIMVFTGMEILTGTPKDEVTMLQEYKEYKQDYELLTTLPQKVIGEHDIDIYKIPSDKIRYTIYNNGENITFSYYIIKRDVEKGNNPYHAVITLSNSGEILSEEYEIEKVSWEEYKYSEQILNHSINIVFTLILLIMELGIILLFVFILRPREETKNKDETQ